MRKMFSIAGAALLAVATLTPQADAQTMSATGVCAASPGPADADQLIDAEERPGNTVPSLFFTVRFQGVPAPTVLGVLVRYDDDLNQQIAQFVAPVNGSSGTLTSALRVSIDPADQGGGLGARGNEGRSERGSARVSGASTSRGSGSGQYFGGGGLGPGLYAFYVYTGEIRDTPRGRRWVANEQNLLVRFTCGVEDDR